MLLPAALVAMSETLYVPTVAYVLEGFSVVLVFPSPKFHNHDVGELAEVSVNWTVRGVLPEVGLPKKVATGESGAVVAVVAGVVVVVVTGMVVAVVVTTAVIVVVTGTVVAVVVTVVLAAAAGIVMHAMKKNPMQMNEKIRGADNPSG